MNPVRNAAMAEADGQVYKRLYDDVYSADNHVELVRLKTHPHYMRRGFGSALVKWGHRSGQRAALSGCLSRG